MSNGFRTMVHVPDGDFTSILMLYFTPLSSRRLVFFIGNVPDLRIPA
jgi:hypothetical protein